MSHRSLVFITLTAVLLLIGGVLWILATDRFASVPPEPPPEVFEETPPLDQGLLEHQVQVGVLSAFPTSTVAIELEPTVIETVFTTPDTGPLPE